MRPVTGRQMDMRRRAPLSIGLVVVAAAALVGVFIVPIGGSDGGSGSVPLVGERAPEIDLESLEGERVRLSAFRGRPVIVNMWATWCIPCRDEFPLLVDAYAEHADAGLEILGIVHDDTREGARRFAEEHGADWPMLFDADDRAWDDYLGVGVPMSFFIDAEGIVRAFSLGGFTEEGLAQQLQLVLPTA